MASVKSSVPRSLVRAERLKLVVEKLGVQASSASELLERLGLAHSQRRSLQRDLELLVRQGEVQRTSDGKRYLVPQRPPLHLNDVEAVAVYSAARLLFHHAGEYNEHYRSALEKLAFLLPGPARALVQATNLAYRRRPNAEQSRAAELVARAWLSGQWLAFDYAASAAGGRARKVELAVYFLEINPQNRAAYAIGLDRTGKRADVRVFKVARMQRPRLLDEVYLVPEDFDPLAFISTAWGIMAGKPVEVVLRFAPVVAERVEEEHWPHAVRCERLADGRTELVLRVGSTLELRPWILGWGGTVEVVAPEELRLAIARSLREAAGLYDSSLGLATGS